MRLWLPATAFVFLAVGCGQNVPGNGAGDGGASDSGTFDAGGPDAGAVDAGVLDAGAVDAGADAGQVGPVGCVTSVSSGHHTFSCDSITYEVELPTACVAGGCGVVFDVHGLTMNANGEEKSTGLRTIGGALGYVIVQPTAPGSLIGPSWTPGTDDPKVWAFLQLLRQALLIDAKRIHFTGFSQGGAMTWRMVCAHADVLASAAPIAAADGTTLSGSSPPFKLDCPFDSTAAPSKQLPILQMHGTADALVPFAKGQAQRDAALAAWSLGSPSSVSSDAKHSHTRYTNANGLVFEFLQHDYVVPPPLVPITLGGHCIPGGNDLPANASTGQTMFFSCAPPSAFVWGQLVMQFFVAHPKP